MKYLKNINELFGFFNKDIKSEPWIEYNGKWEYDVNLPKTSTPCFIKLKTGEEKIAYLEFNKPPYRYNNKSEYPDPYIWVISNHDNYYKTDIKLDDVTSWKYKK